MSGMHHPFISDLSDKSIEDLQEAIRRSYMVS